MRLSRRLPPLPPKTRRRRRAFTLVELLVVATLIVMLTAISVPVLGLMLRDVKLNAAVSRLKAGVLQTRNLLADYPLPDFTQTLPTVPGSAYTGTALVIRWDDARQDYDVFYALSAQTALNPALAGTLRPGLTDPATNQRGFLSSAGPTPAANGADYAYRGYTAFAQLEPMTLGSDVRVAGLWRRHNAGNNSDDGKTELEIVSNNGVPISSFAICMDPTGTAIPPSKAIYVNLQDAPPDAAVTPYVKPCWHTWDVTMYDDPDANTGAWESQFVPPTPANAGIAGKGEGFFTSLPILLVYRDGDLPQAGNSPSGTPWRKNNAKGVPVLNPDLDPNEVLVQTKGRLLMFALQGSAALEY